MALYRTVSPQEATGKVKDVYDDIMATRKVDWINNFWKTLAVQPELLKDAYP